jgi:putative ABC transport system ATP-binding protein
MPALEIRDLTVEYSSGGYAARPIDGLDLDVDSGELVLLLGASGCGKTTLLSVLAGILTPTSGAARFGDLEITALRGAALTSFRRQTVGIVFQAFNLVPSLSARENVEVPLRVAGLSRSAARERADHLLDRVDLAHRMKHRPSDLSGGQQQRVAIARALAHDPPLVLADEPTAHLDYIQVEGVLTLLREIARPGRVVVIATHDERLLPLANRVVELSPRAVASTRDPERRELGDGEVLFRQGDVGDLVYVVSSGRIEIVMERDDGSEELVTSIEPGGYFGELAPLFRLRRSATARAKGATTVVGHSLTQFRELQTSESTPGPNSSLLT